MADRLSRRLERKNKDELVKLLLVLKPSKGNSALEEARFAQNSHAECWRESPQTDPEYHRYTYSAYPGDPGHVDPIYISESRPSLHDIAKPRVREKIAASIGFTS